MLFLSALPLLATGIQSVPYLISLLVFEYWVTRKVCIADIAPIVAGCAVGGLLMGTIFLLNHALEPYVLETFASSHTIVGSLAKVIKVRDAESASHFLGQITDLSPIRVAKRIASDHSAIPMCGFLLLLLGVGLGSKSQSRIRSLGLAGMLAVLLITYIMLAFGRYVIYYQWMGAVPMALIFAIGLEQCWLLRRRELVVVGMFACASAILLGVPDAWWQLGRPNQDVDRQVDQILIRETKAGDNLYGDMVFYYASQARSIPFMTTTYAGSRAFPRMSDEELSRISLLMLTPEDYSKFIGQLGGQWVRVSTENMPYGFSVGVWRRTPRASLSGARGKSPRP